MASSVAIAARLLQRQARNVLHHRHVAASTSTPVRILSSFFPTYPPEDDDNDDQQRPFASHRFVQEEEVERDATTTAATTVAATSSTVGVSGNGKLSPEARKYLLQIEQASKYGNAIQAQQLLLEYCDRYERGRQQLREMPSSSVLANTDTLNLVLSAWSRCQAEDATTRAETWLMMMWREYESGNMPHAKPNAKSYLWVISCWTGWLDTYRRNFDIAPQCAKAMLDEIRQICEVDESMRTIDVEIYNMVISSYAKWGNIEVVQSIVKQLEDDHEAGISAGPPDIISLTNVLLAWERSGRHDAPEQAFQYLKWMISQEPATINAYAFNIVINCWAKNRSRGGPERVEQILDWMLADDDLPNPDYFTFTSVIDCWAKSNQPVAPSRAENLLQKMQRLLESSDGAGDDLKFDISPYNAVLNCWAKSMQHDAAERAQRLLDDLIENSEKNKCLSPDHISFNTVIDCWAKSKAPDAAEQAEKLLLTMHKRYQAGHKQVRPTIESYNSAINASAQRGDAERAEALLRLAYDDFQVSGSTPPNTRTFSSVLKAWSKSGHPEATEHAEMILTRMWELSRAGELPCQPNTFSYLYVITCWTRRRRSSDGDDTGGERAEELLREMVSYGLKPNTFVYNAVCSAWGQNNLDRIISIIHKMKNPDVVTFNTAIRSAVTREEVERVLSLMKSRNVKPDRLTHQLLKRLGETV